MADSHPNGRQRRATTTERITFIVRADNQADVLARVVELFQDLNLEIEAIYMVRRRSSESLRIHVTIETNEGGRRQIEASLEKVLNVRSVKTERSAKERLDPDEADEQAASRR